MAAPESPSLYVTQRAVIVRADPITELFGERVPPIGCPFAFHKAGRVALVVDDKTADAWDQANVLPNHLHQISPAHRRSFVQTFDLNDRMITRILWRDAYGNPFLTSNTKGNEARNMHAYHSSVSPSGFLFFGLQDMHSIRRIIRASDILRSENVDTEIIQSIHTILEFPVDGKLLDLEALKQHLIQLVWDENAPEAKETGSENSSVPRSHLPELATELDTLRFLLTTRGMLIDERISDYLECTSEEEFRTILTRTAHAISVKETNVCIRNPDHTRFTLDPSDSESVSRYFFEYLPLEIAFSLSRIHHRGLKHDYTHMGNFITTGGPVDLDGMKGAALGLGDRPNTNQELIHEALGTMGKYAKLVETLIGQKCITYPDMEQTPYEDSQASLRLVPNMVIDYLRFFEYLDTRDQKNQAPLPSVETLLSEIDEPALRDVHSAARVLKYLEKEIHWDFTFEDPRKFVLKAFHSLRPEIPLRTDAEIFDALTRVYTEEALLEAFDALFTKTFIERFSETDQSAFESYIRTHGDKCASLIIALIYSREHTLAHANLFKIIQDTAESEESLQEYFDLLTKKLESL